MQRISTNATLILKFFIPTVWITFFGAVTIAAFLTKGTFYGIPEGPFKAIVFAFFAIGFLFLWWAVLRLKRMEIDEEYVYVTNYFKTYRYPFSSVEKLNLKDFKFFKTLEVQLKEPGSFGESMTCVISEKLFFEYMQEHPKVAFALGYRPFDS
ncbi:MAG: hypothetical protein HKN16_09935 [Saprospiraceae bacterium]|nr:hypothetical protein [Saprospiraceae bacterium]